jgi:hypothetical protein
MSLKPFTVRRNKADERCYGGLSSAVKLQAGDLTR